MTAFTKQYQSASSAERAVARSRSLIANSVRTPAALFTSADTNSIHFELIDGEGGDLFVETELADVLDALLGIHAATVDGLPTFDPLARIRDRMASCTSTPMRQVVGETVAKPGSSTLHGDFHVGQIIRDRAGSIWVVDLDDMAMGPPEADLGNFTAHLATRSPDRGLEVDQWVDQILYQWRLLNTQIDEECFQRYLALALIRRHLKLREANRPDFEKQIDAYLIRSRG